MSPATAPGDERRARVVASSVLVVLLVFGLSRALSLAWLCDDSFISIRYADNLVEGHGLVYNAGERVEGYTNLSWTLLLAGAAVLGASTEATARYAGVGFYAALALTLAWASYARSRRTGGAFLPLAAGLVLVSDDFHVWASGGLETMLFAWLTAAAFLVTRGPLTRRRARIAGFALALLVATRPDGLLFAIAGIASPWIRSEPIDAADRRGLARAIAAPVVVWLAVWLAWKWLYYGDLLPTAFYSKSVLRPYVSQGLVYVGLYFAKNWYLPVALIGLLAVGRRARTLRSDTAFWLATSGLFTAYLVEIGGDFMFARRLIPVAPLLFLVLETRIARQAPLLRWGPAAATLVAAALPWSPHGGQPGAIAGVYDERLSYPPETLEVRRLQGRTLAAALSGSTTPPRVAFEGGMCSFGYYSRLPYLAEMTGLTQYSIAKRPLVERGVPGHEKSPDAEWFADHHIHLLVRQDLPPVPPPNPAEAIDQIRFGDVLRAQILVYDHAIMDPLRDRPDVSFVPIEDAVARSAVVMESASVAGAQDLLAQLDRYYFRAAGPRGAPLRAPLEAILTRKRAAASSR